jgi:hypothetical protein
MYLLLSYSILYAWICLCITYLCILIWVMCFIIYMFIKMIVYLWICIIKKYSFYLCMKYIWFWLNWIECIGHVFYSLLNVYCLLTFIIYFKLLWSNTMYLFIYLIYELFHCVYVYKYFIQYFIDLYSYHCKIIWKWIAFVSHVGG